MSSLNPSTSHSTLMLTSGRARLWAILVGVTHYEDDFFSILNYSAADCRALGEVLITATQQFPNRRIVTHHNFAPEPPTLEVVRASIQYVVERAMLQDTVLFYFSGHGLVEPNSQEAVLCLSDTRHMALLGTGLQMSELLQMLENCEARQQIVWLDACHSGELNIQGAKGLSRRISADVTDEPTTQFVRMLRTRASQSKGFYAMLSCDQGQRSWEFPELGHGLFTYFLIQGLKGEASDPEGVIAADSLYRYVYAKTVAFITQKNQEIQRLNEQQRDRPNASLYPPYPLQTPKRIVDGVGELVIGLVRKQESSPALAPTVVGQQVSPPPNAEPPRRWQPFLWVGGGILATILLIAAAFPRLSRSPDVGTAPIAARSCNVKPQRLNQTNALPDLQLFLHSCGAEQPWRQPKTQIFSNPEPVWTVKFNPRGDRLVWVGGREGGEIWDVDNLQPIHRLTGHTGWVYEAAISPDGETIATASADRTVRLWNLETGELIRILEGHQDSVWGVAISPDGETIATASADQTLRLWNLETGALVRIFRGHTDNVFTVDFARDGETLISGSEDGTIRVWDVRTGRVLQTLTDHDDTVRAVRIAPNGEWLASASWDQSVKLWDLQTGQALQTFTGHSDRVVTLAFSPDSQTLVSGSTDNTMRLWDLTTKTPLGTAYEYESWILAVGFAPHGKTLVSGNQDGTIVLWQP